MTARNQSFNAHVAFGYGLGVCLTLHDPAGKPWGASIRDGLLSMLVVWLLTTAMDLIVILLNRSFGARVDG